MRYVTGIDKQGRPIDVRDPFAGRLRALADAAGPVANRLAPALLGVARCSEMICCAIHSLRSP